MNSRYYPYNLTYHERYTQSHTEGMRSQIAIASIAPETEALRQQLVQVAIAAEDPDDDDAGLRGKVKDQVIAYREAAQTWA